MNPEGIDCYIHLLPEAIKELSDIFAGLGQDILNASRNITEAMDNLEYTISTIREK